MGYLEEQTEGVEVQPTQVLLGEQRAKEALGQSVFAPQATQVPEEEQIGVEPEQCVLEVHSTQPEDPQ